MKNVNVTLRVDEDLYGPYDSISDRMEALDA